jgi:hypothetical protein
MSHHEAPGQHEHQGTSPLCRVCASSHDPDHPLSGFGICHHCVYKILIAVFIVMIAVSYIVWFGVL